MQIIPARLALTIHCSGTKKERKKWIRAGMNLVPETRKNNQFVVLKSMNRTGPWPNFKSYRVFGIEPAQLNRHAEEVLRYIRGFPI